MEYYWEQVKKITNKTPTNTRKFQSIPLGEHETSIHYALPWAANMQAMSIMRMCGYDNITITLTRTKSITLTEALNEL